MLLLADTSSVIKLVTSGTQVTDVHASYVDRTSSADTGGETNTEIAAATTTTIVASPASSTYRNIRYLSICNKDTTNQTVTVRHFDGTNTIQLYATTLQPGWVAECSDGAWRLIDGSGMPVCTALAGIWRQSTTLTTTGTFTTGAYTNTIYIRGVGGGGGGGGCTATSSAAGGGGGGGSYVEKKFSVSPNTSYSYTIGAQGNGVSGAGGGNGSSSTFIVSGTTVTAPGGTGGPVATGIATPSSRAGGAGGAVSTNGDMNSGGAPGLAGHVTVVGSKAASGSGGDSDFGAGGRGTITAGNGNAALGFGAGGGGAVTLSAAARTGGNGTPGCWVVDEYT